MQYKNHEELPMFLTADDLASLLKISKPKAYELMKQDGFPLIQFGRSMRVSHDEFFQWLNTLTKA
ncbi:helix-turn-helix domain-containing protein [Pseudobacillus badius]|uniref:helix-turn-helix domain-containing protein n=1 Tax=Bacillus badius TaxID=1455 RepID=UPI0007B03F30|nr:helix-turn-helix domain-containing protein [Bacillus badius]KZO01258.1 DNA-binding protein [Bacillus badius]OCS89436.1 DNA-binding protein [Bacillus badius]OVE51186.1 DNA-binding protein [Bacillus badius]TDW02173.1 excisionase family DNA binding protein [Bacillus badius]